jgi:hypothetical protein
MRDGKGLPVLADFRTADRINIETEGGVVVDARPGN